MSDQTNGDGTDSVELVNPPIKRDEEFERRIAELQRAMGNESGDDDPTFHDDVEFVEDVMPDWFDDLESAVERRELAMSPAPNLGVRVGDSRFGTRPVEH